MEIEIRCARAADFESMFDLLKACVAGMRNRGIDQWDEVYPSREAVDADIKGGNAVVAVVDQAIAGFAVLDEHQEPEYGQVPWSIAGRAAVIHRMMVAPAVEGRGIARALMSFLEARASSAGHDTIRLDAFVNNPRALRFYERCDYRRAGLVRFRKGEFFCFEKSLGCPS